jgi:hypothetical protein
MENYQGATRQTQKELVVYSNLKLSQVRVTLQPYD